MYSPPSSPSRGARPTRRPLTRKRPAKRYLELERLEDRTVPALFVVNSTRDLPDAAPGDGDCDTGFFIDRDGDLIPDEHECTLRAAIQEANLNGEPDTILFDIPTTDAGFNGEWWTISINPLLINPEDGSNGLTPLIESGTFIDGFSQPEAGSDVGIGVNLVGTGGTVGVDAIPFPQFEQPEIAIDANTSDHGFSIDGAADDITLLGMAIYDVGPGFDSAAVRGNGGPGTARLVQEMFIGLLPDGSDPGAERNKEFGARQMDGGELTVTRSLVGFNGTGGMDGEASTSVVFFTFNEVFENGWATNSHDGIDVNGKNGVASFNLTYNNRTLNGLPNGGGGNGIELGSNSSSTALDLNVIENNTSFGNVSAGISIRKGPVGNFIEKNVFFHNEVGISVNWEGRVTNRNQISQNSTFLNMGLGIDLQAIQNFVPPDAPETIPDPNDPELAPEPWFGFANGGLPGPAVGPDGVTANDDCDPDEGSNDLQNFPELTSALTVGNQLIVDGRLDSTPLTTFRIEFFATPITDMFGVNDREGRRFVGSILVTTNADCDATFSAQFTASVDPNSEVITATATKFTSENEPWSTSEYGGPITINQVDLTAKVTGGGWIVQPAGSIPAPSSTNDRASFGFVAMYRQGSDIPRGNTNFIYHPTNLHFHSTEYARLSLIVLGGEEEPQNARWRGLGKVNNKPGFGFKVHLTDNGEPGNMDTWRIKIWKDNDNDANTEDGPTVYDNGPAENETILGGGNLQVHIKANALQGVAGEGTGETLAAEALQPVIDQAVAFWRSEGIDEATLSSIGTTAFVIANLPDNILGVTANGVIGIDLDAAGNGWSLPGQSLGGRMDLLSVVTHEVGHLLGFEHEDHESVAVMAATLQPAMRLVSPVPQAPATLILSPLTSMPVTGLSTISDRVATLNFAARAEAPAISSVQLPTMLYLSTPFDRSSINLLASASRSAEGTLTGAYDFRGWFLHPDRRTEPSDSAGSQVQQPTDRSRQTQQLPLDVVPLLNPADTPIDQGLPPAAVSPQAYEACFAEMARDSQSARPSGVALATLAVLAGSLKTDWAAPVATREPNRRQKLSLAERENR